MEETDVIKEFLSWILKEPLMLLVVIPMGFIFYWAAKANMESMKKNKLEDLNKDEKESL